MTFTLAGASSPALTLSSAVGSEITIDDAASWMFTVHPRIMNLAAGYYSWAIELRDTEDRRQTPPGSTIQITPDT